MAGIPAVLTEPRQRRAVAHGWGRGGRIPPDIDGEAEVSWRLIARGMAVVGADGAILGRVSRVLGDPDRDIFDGVAFRKGLFAPEQAVALEQIERITARAVRVRFTAAQADDAAALLPPLRASHPRRGRNWREQD